MATARPIGDLLREWRQRRHLSQLDLACEAEVSTRHLSFLETGRATPSREMVLHLAEQLAVPLRERNALLVAAGYAPVFSQRPLTDPALDSARQAVALLLKAHEPYPALAIDLHWNMVASNRILLAMLAAVVPSLLRPPVNVLRLSLHPQGLASRIVNFAEWRAHLFHRLRQQIQSSADPVLTELLNELRAYPSPPNSESSTSTKQNEYASVIVPLQLRSEAGILSFISTTTVFGTPIDITLSELALETFFPANASTADALRQIAASLPSDDSQTAAL
jgi:transcriptional regulator with XRE-family HTH domain